MKLNIVISVFVLLVFQNFALADAHVLWGQDARDMTQILSASKIDSGLGDVTLEFYSAKDIVCIGENYQDQCEAAAAYAQPVLASRPVLPELAGKLWSLLLKAGFKNQISQIADGSAGKTIIMAGQVDCTIHSGDSSQDECSFQ